MNAVTSNIHSSRSRHQFLRIFVTLILTANFSLPCSVAEEAVDAEERELLLCQAKELRHRAIELMDRNETDAAISLNIREIDLCRQASHGPSIEEAEALRNLGVTCVILRQFNLAKFYLESALQRCRSCVGDEHELTAQIWHDLGVVRVQLGETEQGKNCFKAALALQGLLLGEEHPTTVKTLCALAGTECIDAKDWDFCTQKMKSLWEVQRRALGDADENTLATQLNLAACYCRTEEPMRALNLCRSMLKIAKSEYGELQEQTVKAYLGVGVCCIDLDRLEEAEFNLEQALQIARQLSGSQDQNVAEALYRLGSALRHSEKYDKARACLDEALGIRQNLVGLTHRETADVWYELGRLHAALKDWKAAKDCFEEEYRIRRFNGQGEKEDLADSLYELGIACEKLGLTDEARRHQTNALDIYRSIGGDECPGALEAQDALANLPPIDVFKLPAFLGVP